MEYRFMCFVRFLGMILITIPCTSAWAEESKLNSPEAKELAALMLNMNGLLCAKALEIRALKVRQEIHEVRCIEYRGGSGQKTYMLNTKTGKAWQP